jgi:hypothetical protein
MLTVSDRFLASLRESHTISVAATLYAPSAPTVPINAPVVGGQVTIDKDARVRRQASLDVAFSLADATTRDTVRELPYGGYATLERGVRYPDGTVERVQLGRFRVESVVWSELEGMATLTLADRMAQIQDEPFVTPYAAGGQHPTDAIVAIVTQVFGSTIAYHVTTTPATEPTLQDTVYAEDRAAAISDLASSISASATFDHLGDFVLKPSGPSTEVAWTLDAGERGVLIASQETLDRSSVRNGVSVRGQVSADQPPLYALATNDDPDSPTRWGGPFGKVVMIVSSTAVSSQADADATAASLLNLRLGLARTLVLQGVPNPALEPDDLIEIVFADGRTETQTVNRVQIGLGVDGTLELTTTSQLHPDLEPAHVRMYTGRSAWRQLEDAVSV